LFGRESKDSEEFNHDVNYHCGQGRSRFDLVIDLKPTQEVIDAFKDFNEGLVVCLLGLRRLVTPEFRRANWNAREKHTERRTLIAENTYFAGGNTYMKTTSERWT